MHIVKHIFDYDEVPEDLLVKMTMLRLRKYDNLCDVKDALQSKELKKKVSESYEGGSESGLVVSRGRKERDGGKKGKSRSKSKSKGPRCYHCKEPGHFRRDCPQCKTGKESKESDGKAIASVVRESSDEGEYEGSDVLTVATSSLTDTWIMDSGASYHMTFNKDWFNSFKKWNSSVRLGDDKAIPVLGTGSVQIKMYDETVRIIEAWYVPDLRKNLIALATLDNHGYKFTGGDGQLKVSKGAITVMKGKRQHGIYVLIGNTMTGTVAVSSYEQSVDCTELWHCRLGHMSEQGFTILSKKRLLNGAETGKLKLCETCVMGKQHRVKFRKSDRGVVQKVEFDVETSKRIFENPENLPIEMQQNEYESIATSRVRRVTKRPASISWKATLQSTVALFTTEAEYMSLTAGVKEGFWLLGLVGSLGLEVQKPAIYCDSQSALCLAKNPVYHERSKHIDVRLNFIRDVIEENVFSIEKIATTDNPADMLTKPLRAEKFKHSLDLCCSAIVQHIDAPLLVVWSFVHRFDDPTTYKHFVRSCHVISSSFAGPNSVGSLHCFEVVSGLTTANSTEQWCLTPLTSPSRIILLSISLGLNLIPKFPTNSANLRPSLHPERGKWRSLTLPLRLRASSDDGRDEPKLEYTPWLIAGLGNPGTKFHGTRHNVGFEMIDRISKSEGVPMNVIQSKALLGIGSIKDVPVILAKPQTYVNFCGESVGALAAYYGVPLRHILLVYDEMSLPNGVLRFQPKGGHGHHSGVKSVMAHLERRSFARLCIGIGNPPGTMDMKAFLLQKFSSVERKQVDAALDQAVDGVRNLLLCGFDQSIEKFNLGQKYKYHKPLTAKGEGRRWLSVRGDRESGGIGLVVLSERSDRDSATDSPSTQRLQGWCLASFD
ncbi:hypothetical protein MLD38_024409 [Melastoma candidum]|uniref:Uncharacterized protein n=1 Tax=Melastoma candidum TaxID=119954 RepID=A0ACB9NX93_9MYRT|nr:hypothetical protein MLD38_024409 [Melastoma candidum]